MFSVRIPLDIYTFEQEIKYIILEMWSFDNKKSNILWAHFRDPTPSSRVEPTTFVLQSIVRYHFATGVLFCRHVLSKFRYI